MKRSEMIMLLDKELYNQKCMDQNITGQDILRIVEEAGMLPPRIEDVSNLEAFEVDKGAHVFCGVIDNSYFRQVAAKSM